MNLRRFDCGVGVSVGTELFRHYQVKLGYDFGLVDTKKNNGADKQRNSQATLSLTYLF